MAKDRTRHARRREPERVGTSLYDMVAQGMGRALVGLAEGAARGLADFADAVLHPSSHTMTRQRTARTAAQGW